MNKMMIARRRIIESLSKITRWIYKAGDADFFEGSKEGSNYGLSFSPIAARRLRLSPYTLHWVTIYVPGGDQVREEKQIGGYVNIGDTLATGELRPYDFTPYKQIVVEVESGSGVIGYGAQQTDITKKLDNTHTVNPPVKLEIPGAGKYIMDISRVNTANYICVGSNQFIYGAPQLVISNIYFK